MTHVCTDIFFRIWDGKTRYTVNYSPSLNMWFVFEGTKEEDALAKFELNHRTHTVNADSAVECLEEYLNPGSNHFEHYKCTRYHLNATP